MANQNVDERLTELLALEVNWNSYRALPVDRDVAERVRGFFPLADKLGLNPWICPLPDGGLQIERAGVDDYSVEFAPDGTASAYFDGISDKDALGLVALFAQMKALDAAQGIEAATAAETVKHGSVHESPVGEADAPEHSSEHSIHSSSGRG